MQAPSISTLINTLTMSSFCKVCNHGIILHGIGLCEACRSFYARNRNKVLTCNRGTYNYICLTDNLQRITNVNAVCSRSGQVWRFLCPACRMEKCKQVKKGLDTTLIPKKTMAKDSAMMEIHIKDSGRASDPSGLEIFIKGLVITCEKFIESLNKMPMRKQQVEFLSAKQVWDSYCRSVGEQIKIMKNFSSCFPFYSKLNVQDRVALMLATKFRLIAGEGMIHVDHFYMAGMSSATYESAKNVMPELATIFEQGKRTWEFFKCHPFTKVEGAFFLAFLCFADSEVISEEGKLYLDTIITQLFQSYHAYMTRVYPIEHIRMTRIRRMSTTIDLICKEASWRNEQTRNVIIPKLETTELVSTMMYGDVKQYLCNKASLGANTDQQFIINNTTSH